MPRVTHAARRGRQAVLFLKKKNQKNFSPLLTRTAPTPVAASQQTRLTASNCRASFRTEAKVEKSFFGSFFSKKERLHFLPLAFEGANS
jgi:hypothetical protein